jgi:hypothetical protein
MVIPDVPVLWENREQSELAMIPKGTTGLEIGVLRGTHAMWLWKNTSPKKLCLIDYWTAHLRPDGTPNHSKQKGRDKQHQGVLDMFTQEIAAGLVHVTRGRSGEVVGKFPDLAFDWIVVDGDHTIQGAYEDIYNYYPKIKVGGLMICHDYTMLAKEKKGCAVPESLAMFMEHSDGLEFIGKSAELYACNAILRKKK